MHLSLAAFFHFRKPPDLRLAFDGVEMNERVGRIESQKDKKRSTKEQTSIIFPAKWEVVRIQVLEHLPGAEESKRRATQRYARRETTAGGAMKENMDVRFISEE